MVKPTKTRMFAAEKSSRPIALGLAIGDLAWEGANKFGEHVLLTWLVERLRDHQAVIVFLNWSVEHYVLFSFALLILYLAFVCLRAMFGSEGDRLVPPGTPPAPLQRLTTHGHQSPINQAGGDIIQHYYGPSPDLAKGEDAASKALDGGKPTEGQRSLPTLKELFENDWPDLPAFYHVATVESDGLQSRKVAVAWRLEGDFAARSKFLAFFLEPATPPDDALKICHHIASNCQHFINTADSEVDIAGKAPGDTLATHLKDMVFSKRVFIYYEHPDFSLEHKGLLEGAYRNAGFSVQFRDSAYVWLRRDHKITVRPVPLKPNSTLLPSAQTNDGLIITVTVLKEYSMPPSNPPGDSLGSQSPESTTHDRSNQLPSQE